MKIDQNDPVSVETVNKKIEAFVEVVLGKLTDQMQEIAALKRRVKELENHMERVDGI